MAQMTHLSKNNTKVSRQRRVGFYSLPKDLGINGEFTVVTLHNTDILTFNEDWIILNTAGYYTATTKCRMNQASCEFHLGYTVNQKDFKWSVNYRGKNYIFKDDKLILPRTDEAEAKLCVTEL